VLKPIPYPGAVRRGITTIGRVSTVDVGPGCGKVGANRCRASHSVVLN